MNRIDERSQLVRNTASSYAARGVLLLSALALTPYLYRRLGPGGFGTWAVMLTLITIFSLVEIGFSDGVVRQVARFRAEGRRRELEQTIGAAVALMILLAALPVAVIATVALAFDGLAAEAERADFRVGLLILGAAMLLRFPCVAYAAALRGYQRYDLANLSSILTALLFSVGAVVAIEAGTGVAGLAVVQSGALAGGGLLYAISFHRIEPHVSLAPRLGERDARRSILGFSSFTLAAESFNYIGQRLDVVIIAALRSAGAAGPYAAVLKLQSGVQSLTLPFVDLLMPMASDLWARGEREALVGRLALATRVAMQLTLPFALAFSLFASDVVDLWLGGEAPDVTAWIVVLLMAVQVLGLTAAPARRILVGVGRVRLIAFLSMLEGLASVVLTIVLVSAYGAVGAAVATLIAVALVAPSKLPIACRTLGTPIARFLAASVGRALLGTAPAALALVLVRVLLPAGALRLAVGLAAGILLGGAAALLEIGPRRGLDAIRSGPRLLGGRGSRSGSELVSALDGDSRPRPSSP